VRMRPAPWDPVDNAEAASRASVILKRTGLISQIHPGRTRREPEGTTPLECGQRAWRCK